LKKLKPACALIATAIGSRNDAAALADAQGRFYNLKNELIILSGGDALRDETLHDLRKLAKTTHYTLEIIGPAFPGFTEAEAFTEAVKTLHHELGAWHDYHVGLAYLHDFLTARGIDSGAEPYAALAAELGNAAAKHHDAIPVAFGTFNEIAMQI